MCHDKFTQELLSSILLLSRQPLQKEALEFSRGELGILDCLYKHNGLSAGELRENLAVCSGRIADALKVLESKGLIVRIHDSSDHRRVIVYLSDSGRRLIELKLKSIEARLSAAMACLGSEDAREFIRIVGKLARMS